MNNQEIAADLRHVWNRFSIIAVTLRSDSISETDLPEIADMIDDLLIDNFQPAIEAIERAEG